MEVARDSTETDKEPLGERVRPSLGFQKSLICALLYVRIIPVMLLFTVENIVHVKI